MAASDHQGNEKRYTKALMHFFLDSFSENENGLEQTVVTILLFVILLLKETFYPCSTGLCLVPSLNPGKLESITWRGLTPVSVVRSTLFVETLLALWNPNPRQKHRG